LAFLLSKSELLLTAIEKIACSSQRTLQFDDRPFQAGVQEPNHPPIAIIAAAKCVALNNRALALSPLIWSCSLEPTCLDEGLNMLNR
jgi:hypothetical protein